MRLALAGKSLLWTFFLFLGTASSWALSLDLAKALGNDDFGTRSQALDRIIGEGDADSLRILESLQNGTLGSTSDGRVVVIDGDMFRDASSGAIIQAQKDDVQPLELNNVLRLKVAHGIAAIQLKSPDRSIRARAIGSLLNDPDPALKPLVETARAQESDTGLRARLDQLWALTALHDTDPGHRREAVALVAQRHDPQLLPLLQSLAGRKPDGTYQEPDVSVRQAAERTIAGLHNEEFEIQLVGTLFAGLSLGSILLLAALGLAITYGLIGVINMAHGEFLMIGAYATFCVQGAFLKYWPGAFDWYPLVAVPVSFLAAAVAGLILERLVLRKLYGRPLETLLATFGLSLILIQCTRMIFGAQNVQVSNPRWMSGGISVLPELILPYNRIVIIGFGLAVVLVTWFVLNKTRLGLYVRAVTQNRRMAACLGVRTWQVDCYAFAFGAGIAGLGGCALSQIGNVGPDLGQSYIIDSFMAVVLGGVGQLAGTIVGALGLGVLSKFIEPFWGAVLAKIAVLVLIVLFIQKRPQGLFALKGRSSEL